MSSCPRQNTPWCLLLGDEKETRLNSGYLFQLILAPPPIIIYDKCSMSFSDTGVGGRNSITVDCWKRKEKALKEDKKSCQVH